MNRKQPLLSVLGSGAVLTALLISLAPSAQAEHFAPERPPRAEAPMEGARALRINLNEAAEMVQRQTGGRILAAQSVRDGGRPSYRIKVLTGQGEVRIVFVDAETGAME